MKINAYIGALLLTQVLGCATMPGFIKEYIKAGDFTLMTYQRFNRNADTIRIYIEGDGRAWETKHRLSDDPTPLNPVALRLAAIDPADNIAYIARPGQYSPTGMPDCDSKYWSGSRFSKKVINSFDRAIDLLKKESHARQVDLIGYSGGGAIAVLVAAERSDVVGLRTVAGNLDSRAFCQYHHVSELNDSMDPIDVAKKIAHIPQRHFAGSKDKIVPFAIAESFVMMEGDSDCRRITIVKDAAHNDGWTKRWKKLLSLPLIAIPRYN
jgi:hypothetical protein